MTRRAVKEVQSLGGSLRRRVNVAIDGLAHDPRPPGSLKLTDLEKTWRIRVGDYRIIYEIHDDQLVILIVRIGHRREIYR